VVGVSTSTVARRLTIISGLHLPGSDRHTQTTLTTLATQATQAINRGMSLEPITAMLGHRGMDMTVRYAPCGMPRSPTALQPAADLDCAFEAICRSCSFFQPGPDSRKAKHHERPPRSRASWR
jgi:hypothetical protein